MAKVRLNDDTLAAGVVAPVREAWLAQDPSFEAVQVNPTVIVRQRERSGFDDAGDPTFEWIEVVEGTAVLWDARKEYDGHVGRTGVKARAVVLYDGDVNVTETASVTASTGETFRVEVVRQLPDRLEFEMWRVAG